MNRIMVYISSITMYVIRVSSASVGLNLMKLNFSVIAPNIKGGRNTLYKQMHFFFFTCPVIMISAEKTRRHH